MPPLVIGGDLMKEVVVAQPPAALGVEKEPPSGGVAKEARQAVKDAQPISSPTSLAIQDPEVSQSPISQDPKPV